MYLILGIDPGITTAFSAIDLNGNLVGMFSSRKIGLDRLIEEISKVGTPVIVSCDVRIPPQVIGKVAARFGAKVISPQYDLKVGEKQRIISDFFAERKFRYKFENVHQKDAYASAVFAFNKYRKLFDRIKRELEVKGKEHLLDSVKKKIVTGEAESIDDALHEKPDNVMLQHRPRERFESEKSKATLYREENAALKNIVEQLRLENKELREKLDKIYREQYYRADKHVRRLAQMRKLTIESLERQIKIKDEIIAGLKKIIYEKSKELTEEKLAKLIEEHRSRKLS